MRMRSSTLGLSLGLLLSMAMCSAQGLEWETTTLKHTAKVGQDLIELAFPFSNPTAKPLTVVDIKPSCGCVSAQLEQKTLAQGEKGRLEVFFDARNLSGEHRQSIQVFTTDSPKPTTLTLHVTIPPWLEISPRLIWWSIGEKIAEKTIVITPCPDATARIASVTVDSDAFELSQQTEGSGRAVRLTARPRSTTAAVQAVIKIVAEIPGSAPRSYIVYAQVR